MKYFTYYGCEFKIELTHSYGRYVIIGLSGKYDGYKAYTTDSVSYDNCDSDNKRKRMEARRCLYTKMQMAYDSFKEWR